MAKLTFDEVMDRLADDRSIDIFEVSQRALQRKVWIAEWHIPGCLSESSSVCLTKNDAIETCLMYADNPHGMKTALRKYGRFDSQSELYGTCVNTVSRQRLADCF